MGIMRKLNIKSLSIPLKTKLNNNGEIEKTYISFKGKGQLPLVMVIREYRKNNDVVWADCLFSTHIEIGKLKL